MTQEFKGDRFDFLTLLEKNRGVLIFKFTADWCSPCQKIKPIIDKYFETISSEKIQCYEVNVDECFDLFAFMKTKKMIKGIPTILAYKKETTSFISDDSISGTDLNEISHFFNRCKKMC
jgi:thiol-disulfide isomerase/thioredoxin